jgi:hypothetical protein
MLNGFKANRGLDLFFLHSNVVPDKDHMTRWPEVARRMTLYATFVDHVRPIFERSARV